MAAFFYGWNPTGSGASLEDMRETLGPQVRVDPGSLKSQFNAELAGLVQGCFASRLCASDSRLFGDADERRKVVSNRLGWVAGPAWLEEHIPELIQFAGHIRDKGFAHVLAWVAPACALKFSPPCSRDRLT